MLSAQMGARTDKIESLGGGRKGVFLLLRYVFIVAAAYMLVFQGRSVVPVTHAAMIAVALTSNLALSLVQPELLFAWYVEAPVLIADTLWVSWAIHSTGAEGQEFFLLYFFVLFLAALGESVPLVLLGSTTVGIANIALSAPPDRWATPNLLKIIFFYTVALFYGHVIGRIKSEQQRANRGFAWAKELEVKVSERTLELAQLYEESLAASHMKSEFIANMSHELRTPLNIIIGYSELLLDAQMRPESELERQDMLGRILTAARGQARLVGGVLDLGRIDSGKLPLDHSPIGLQRFVASLKERPHAPLAKGVTLEWRATSSSALLETDPERLSLVVDHLIDNAIKFTKQGAITVTVRDLPHRQCVELSVEDTGPGIAAPDLRAIFEPFQQSHDPANRACGGIGLGLTIANQYVGLLGGKMAVHSIVGAGSQFTVNIPYHAPAVNAGSILTSTVVGSSAAPPAQPAMVNALPSPSPA
jgi:signal transduction histidine kinase